MSEPPAVAGGFQVLEFGSADFRISFTRPLPQAVLTLNVVWSFTKRNGGSFV
ncbi:MAG TPA: hypothetical protein PKY59_21700 [Pyrinomonadaceae bacterium]|nr:hypothetical protein [Pyrinomonadaceae bacterium]